MAKHNPPTDPWAEAQPKGRKAERAANKAAKKARKADKTPWYKQIWQVFQMTRKAQPLIWLWMLCFVLGAEAIAVLLGTFVWSGRVVYLAILALPIGLMGAMIFLARRAERAAYGQIEGQPGAAFAALGQIKRGWSIDQEPIAVDPKSQDMIFRAVGRPGVVLVADGNPGRLSRMVKKEQQRIGRLAPGVKVIKLQVGNGEGEVPLRKLARRLQRLKPSMSKAEVAAVNSRLKSMGGLKLPMPKGIDPLKARPDRRALRGR
ncbi:MAG: DUF4191 domain-containing protein [Micrococcales bacterium]|nr:DUF4191 domain-containing protein [Micrococcales bacterium]